MAKSTRAGGATFTQHELTDPHPPVVISRAELGRVDQLAGTDYLEPLSSAPQSSEHVTQSLPGPTHTTENLFSRTGEEAEDSFADSTVGDGPTEISKPYDEMTLGCNACQPKAIRFGSQ